MAALLSAAFGCCMTQDSVSMNNIQILARIKCDGHRNRPMIVSFILFEWFTMRVYVVRMNVCVGVGCGLRMIRVCALGAYACAFRKCPKFLVLFKF